jgi:hypothetical protein
VEENTTFGSALWQRGQCGDARSSDNSVANPDISL